VKDKMIKCYHVTSEKNLDSIFKNGLLIERFIDKVVWVFKYVEDVEIFLRYSLKHLGIDNVIIECLIPEYQLRRGEWKGFKEYYTEKDVPANRIIKAWILKKNRLIEKENFFNG